MPSATIRIDLVQGPLNEPGPIDCEAAGCTVCFNGIVRPNEAGRPLLALDYSVYEPMAVRQLRLLAERFCTEHGLMMMQIEHSYGRVSVGGCSFRLTIASQHRKEALAAMDGFIDAMKRDVPIWKTPVFVGQEAGTRP